MNMNLFEQANYIKEKFPEVRLEPLQNDNQIIYVPKNKIIEVLTFLRDDSELSFKTMIDLFGADMLGIRNPRFEVIYVLLSYKLNNRITLKVALDDGEKTPSIVSVYSAAGWFEREAYDMYGIVFEGNPDLRRILTDYGFEGHPLRKDFPLTGYKEVRYDAEQQKVIYEPVKLLQEFRKFDFDMPWEGPNYKQNKS